MVDTHEHSAFSGDAKADIGIDAQVAQSLGYNAVFLTDHDRGTGFQIDWANGNYQAFINPIKLDPKSGTWTPKPATGTAGAQVPVLASSHAHGGSGVSAHLSVLAATKAVGSMIYTDRGPALNAGPVTISFWLYPQTLTGSAGADVSVSLGGDASTGPSAIGYTDSNGVPHGLTTPKKSTVLVWQVGKARTPAQNGTTDVLVNALHAPTMQTWNHYTVNVMTGATTWSDGAQTAPGASTTSLNNLPLADRPDTRMVVLTYDKMEAATTGAGTADVYFDDYVAESAGANCPAQEFVDRDNLIDSGTFNTATFRMYPAREMGQTYHANQFVFDPTSASQYYDNANDNATAFHTPEPYGDDNALCASSNNPSALWHFENHGIDNISTVQQKGGYPVQLNHPGVTESVAAAIANHDNGADLVEVQTGDDYSSPWDQELATGVQVIGTYGTDAHRGPPTGGPANFIYAPSNGRDDLLHSLFEGRSFMALNTFKGHIGFNLSQGDGTTPYPARYPIYLPAGQTSAQAWLDIDAGLKAGYTVKWFSSSGLLDANKLAPQLGNIDPINDPTVPYDKPRTVPLGSGFTYVRAAVYDANGNLYANTQPIFFKPVTGMPAGMSARVDSISPPANAACDCTIAMTKGITSIGYSGTILSLGLTNPAGSHVELRVQSPQAPVSVTVDSASVPRASSLAAYQGGSSTSWFYDGTAKLLYLRDVETGGMSSIAINSSTGGGGGGGGGGGTQTFTPTADTYVDSASPTASYGKNAKLRVDNSPSTVESYLRFNLNGISGTVTAVTLKLYATSSLNAGFFVNTVQDDTWTEAMNWNNHPQIGGQIGTAQNVLLNTYVTVTLPPTTVTGNGDVNLALTPNSAIALSLASRDDPEPTHAPQLIVTTS